MLEGATANRLIGAHHKTLVICSQDGTHGTAPMNKFEQLGFEKIYSLAGGINGWEAQGFVLVSE